MLRFLGRLISSSGGRLSRRIVFWVFISVVIIEAIILIPSYLRRERELLAHRKEVSLAQINMILQATPSDASAEKLFERIMMIRNDPIVKGGALYTPDGKAVGSFGERPEPVAFDRQGKDLIFSRNQNGTRYDLVCLPADLQRNYVLILRHDGTPVKHALNAFTLRIAGLVVIISIFVTAGAWLALNPLVVTPILNLRKDLNKAGNAISRDTETPDFYSASVHRRDELGDVIQTFMNMYTQISEAVDHRKRAERELQKSLAKIAAYSKALDNELNNGRQMQMNFLPGKRIEMPGWELAALFKPARQVSGDFYDTFELPGSNLGIVVADVCDKGVGAALFMALFRSLIRIFSGQTALNGLTCHYGANGGLPETGGTDDENTPAHIAEALKAIKLCNGYVAENHGDLAMFATIFFGVLEPCSGRLFYVNGGHEPPLVLNGTGDVRLKLEPTGPAVGIRAEADFGIRNARLDAGNTLLVFTDGLLEARSPADEFFGMDNLLCLLKKDMSSAADILSALTNGVASHTGDAEQFDDITLLAVRRLPLQAGCKPLDRARLDGD